MLGILIFFKNGPWKGEEGPDNVQLTQRPESTSLEILSFNALSDLLLSPFIYDIGSF